MVRLYLDWNIYKFLKTKQDYPQYSIQIEILDNLIKEYRNYVLIPYSNSHISDLRKNIDLENATNDIREKIHLDLNFIDYLSQSNYLDWDSKNTSISPYIASAHQVSKDYDIFFFKNLDFEDVIEHFNQIDIGKNDIASFVSKFNSNYTYNDEIDKIGDLFKKILSEIDLSSSDIVANQNSIFKEINDSKNLWELMKHSFSFFQSFFKDHNLYKELKELSKQHFYLPTEAGNWKNNVIEKIESNLQEKNVDISFIDLIKLGDNKTVFDYFLTSFFVLEFIGYKSEAVNKRKDFSNIMNDSIHAFNAAHCDIFITDDEKLFYKTKALYERFNINTKVIWFRDLEGDIDLAIETMNNKNIVYELLSYIKEDYKVDNNKIVNLDEANPYTQLYILPKRFFGYFDRLQVEVEEYGGKKVCQFILMKAKKNYSKFIFFREIETLIENIDKYLSVENTQQRKNEIEVFVKENSQEQFLWTFDILQQEDKGLITLQKGDNLNFFMSIFIPF